MKKKLLLTLAVLTGLTSAMATDAITSSDFRINLGETKTFGIQLSNEATNYVGFQMDLTLPEGLTVNKAACSLSNRITDENQELTIGKQGDNIYRLTSTSFSLTPISGTSGDLVTVSVTASNTYQGGDATISNIQFATSNSERVTMENVSLGINVSIISFADENVKALCVANWDTNDDGELDQAEAAAVTDLENVYRDNSVITSFDELQYFTGLTSIDGYAFSGCSGLTSITIPNCVTSIGYYAFLNCSSLTSITIPESLAYINYSAFIGCSGLTSIMVESGNSVYDSRDNCNAIIAKETNMLIRGCQNTVIPNDVTSIGEAAFSGSSNLTSITIPNSVTSIGSQAFGWCSGLTSITIPSSVTLIVSDAFSGCSGLTSITVDSENSVYDSRDNCNAIIEKSTNTLIAGFQNTVIPSSVTSIGNFAFQGCSSLTSVTIPSSVTSIGGYAFEGCSGLTSVTIPNSVTSIDGYAFLNCSSLASVTLPNSVKNIGYMSFGYCSALTSIEIPNSVTTIENYAFLYSGLTSVVVNISSPLTIPEETFSYRTSVTLYVPKNSKTAYAAADVWKEFKTIKEFPDPDVNQDGTVDVVDVVDVARFVIGTPSDSFDKFLADLNSSGEVNVADAVVLVNEIAGDVDWSRSLRAPAASDGTLTLTKNDDQSLSFSLEGNSAYTAFQFDLMMPEGMDVTQMTLNSLRKQNHQLLFNNIGEGHYRVVALSTSNQSFNGTVGELLCIALDGQPVDGIVIDDIHFVTEQGDDLLFSAIGISDDTPTCISGVRDNANSGNGKVYNLNGQRLTKAQKGLYIIDGRKVMIK